MVLQFTKAFLIGNETVYLHYKVTVNESHNYCRIGIKLIWITIFVYHFTYIDT